MKLEIKTRLKTGANVEDNVCNSNLSSVQFIYFQESGLITVYHADNKCGCVYVCLPKHKVI